MGRIGRVASEAVNDVLGHTTGDAVLVEVAKRLRASIRDADFACRLGGDEFVILLPDICEDDAVAIARRIIARLSEPFAFAPSASASASPRHPATAPPPTNC